MKTEAEVIQEVKEIIASHPLVVFMKGSTSMPRCGFSATAAEILKNYPYPVKSVDILERQDIREYLPDFSDWPTFPQIFIGGELIGGSDILTQLYQSGQLEGLLKKAHPEKK